MPVTIYHNPKCSKSRGTMDILAEKDIQPVVVEYLKTPPDSATLERFLDKLGMEPRDFMRKKEAPYVDLDLGNDSLDRAALIQAIVDNPILMERPIVVSEDGEVRIGRPPENVLEIL